MKHIVVTSLVMGISTLVVGSGSAYADTSVLKRGEWSCKTSEKSRKYFRDDLTYDLTISTGRNLVRTMEFRYGTVSLIATESDIAYVVESGRLLKQAQHGYISFSNQTEDFTKVQITVAVKESEGTYRNVGFDCETESEPKVLVLKAKNFACSTDNELEGKIRNIKFKVVGLGTPDLAIEGNSDAPVKVTPKHPGLANLNENLTVADDDQNTLILHGDADGITYTDLILYKNSGYEKGAFRITDQSGGDSNFFGNVTCEVK